MLALGANSDTLVGGGASFFIFRRFNVALGAGLSERCNRLQLPRRAPTMQRVQDTQHEPSGTV